MRWSPLLLVVASLLPQPAAAIPTRTYYHRDFTFVYYPFRAFWGHEAAQGHWAFWNPYSHEGTPTLPALYPLELLHALSSSPEFVSWLLTLHFPLAALAAHALARDLGLRRPGALLAGAIYATGGLCLSALDLHCFLYALAWAPLVARALRRTADVGTAAVPPAALMVAVVLSTQAVEFAAQAIALGLLLAAVTNPRGPALARAAGAAALGVGVAALPIALMLAIVRESSRGAGFPLPVVLANSVHPFTLLQVVVPGLFGRLVEGLWWMRRFFSIGFPYFQSLYLGAPVLALAAVGVSGVPRRIRFALLGAGVLGLWLALGPWGGLAPAVLEVVPVRAIRYPCKAMLLPYLVACLFAGAGLDRLRSGAGTRTLRWALLAATAPVAALAAWVAWRWDGFARFIGKDPELALPARRLLLEEAAVVALIALVIVALSALRKTTPARSALYLAVLVAADLARAGAQINPQVPPDFYRLAPPLRALSLDRIEGRVFSLEPVRSPALGEFMNAVAAPGGMWEAYLTRQLEGAYSSAIDRVRAAEDIDRTSLAPHPSSLADAPPSMVGAFLPGVRAAGTAIVLALDAIDDPNLVLFARFPAGPPNVFVHAYHLVGALPRSYVACRVLMVAGARAASRRTFEGDFDPLRDVVLAEPRAANCGTTSVTLSDVDTDTVRQTLHTDGDGVLVLRDSFASGWEARLDGRPVSVLRANGHYRAIAVPPGDHEVFWHYAPPRFRIGSVVSAASLLCVLGLWAAARRTRRPPVL